MDICKDIWILDNIQKRKKEIRELLIREEKRKNIYTYIWNVDQEQHKTNRRKGKRFIYEIWIWKDDYIQNMDIGVSKNNKRKWKR